MLSYAFRVVMSLIQKRDYRYSVIANLSFSSSLKISDASCSKLLSGSTEVCRLPTMSRCCSASVQVPSNMICQILFICGF